MLYRAGDGATLSGVAHRLRKPFRALLQLASRTAAGPDRVSAANAALSFASALPRFHIIAPFCLFAVYSAASFLI